MMLFQLDILTRLKNGQNMQLCESFLFPAMLVAVLLLPTANARRSNETDMRALLEFKSQITYDPLGVLTSWNGSLHLCQWYGVTCDRKHQRVARLYLRSSKLGGSISPNMGNLSFLRVLDMSNNSFRGDIPPQLGRLRRLRTLSLANNSLSGEIPSNLSRCSFLVSLRLRGNNLTGKIPAEIGQLTKLLYFEVRQNKLTGTIPSSFGNLSSITYLDLPDNDLTGNVPETLGKLTNLIQFALGVNQFTGIIPSSILNLTSIRNLDLEDNLFQGNISPSIFTSLKNLEFCGLSINQFTGSIPSSVSNASNIIFLEMGSNNLEGKVPSLQNLNNLQSFLLENNNLGSGGPDDLNFLCSLQNASSLEILTVDKNNLGGVIPQCIGNLSSTLRYLYLAVNQIHGSIPTSIGNLANLWYLYMSKNNLSGSIPQSFGKLQNLGKLGMDSNNLSGTIPDMLGNLTNLIILDLSGNHFQGIIPPSLGKCKNLQALDLSANNLSGTLPAEVMGLSSLTMFLGFYGNRLTGSIPKEIGNLRSLSLLVASDNMFSGEIPIALGECTSLEFIYLDGNHFQGSIPSSLSSLRGLQVIVLSHNNLSGQIPDFLASFMFMTKLDLAFNEFEGMVPTEGVFRNASAASLEGNKMLCGGIPEFHLPTCNFHSHKHKDKTKIIVASALAILGVCSVWLLVFLLRGRKKKEEQTSSNSENPLISVSYHDLHRATDGFSPSNLIGVGTFASVYKGILNEAQQLIAVKVINMMHHGAVKSFLAECEALKNTRHRNLVKVLSVCSSIDHQNHDFKALVYEFMVNGSLEEWLHPPLGDDAAHQAQKKLTLCQRVNTAIDVASALEYLHFECGTPLVHCDIKPSNVLLDDELVAHVSDFGIAKFLSRDIPSTNNSSSLGLRGTIGYAPPEYGLGNDISTKGDVYSYGILLLEMFIGKRPTTEVFQDGWSLHELAKKSLSDGVVEVIDPVVMLQEIGETQEASTSRSTNTNRHRINQSRAIECLTSIVRIGVACSSEIPEERTSMSEVTPMLRSIRSKLLGRRR